jgi:hypothetical protein
MSQSGIGAVQQVKLKRNKKPAEMQAFFIIE